VGIKLVTNSFEGLKGGSPACRREIYLENGHGRHVHRVVEAGADVLFAPGLHTLDQIRAVCSSVSRPVNVLVRPGLSLRDVVEAGARRLSVGGGLAWVAAKAVVDAATALRDSGDCSVLGSRLAAVDGWLLPRGRSQRPPH
jgi:hypothetical protein